ncbi:clusterin-associated protein 1 [Trichonephila inaurata madagascariensis]|uniref:Clusterin-associated protein 1 n=1 Tax=Trichonephila inaurata madagascariensis TaxID=2747483 RepID=A0A8X6ITB0_9ARAC|nr:clusterin-associated protein 1 [Trichonephila inaurata madagascariensis]
MSYKDVRSFTEMMRALGYPRLISLENFRFPNFTLVAEILQWLVKRYDPNVELPDDIDTEQDRVIFIKSIVQFMAIKGYIKLNAKKLYTADGYAVKELLKLTSLLYEAMKTKTDNDLESLDDDSGMSHNFDISSKSGDLKVTRQLASEITLKGASLYDLLLKEIDLRENRSQVLSKQLDITEIEQGIRNATRGLEEEIQKTNTMIENIAADEANLEAKIEKRRMDLERNQKRLQTLKSVRPAFMDEYERLEVELEELYKTYVMKYTWMAYLEQQLEELERLEQELMLQKEEVTKRMVEKLRQDDLLRSEETGNLDDFLIVNVDNDNGLSAPPREKPRRPQPAPSGVRRDAHRRVYGSMSGGDKDDDLDTDSDIDLDGEDDDGSEVSDDDQDLENLSDLKIATNSTHVDSDNDF